MTDTEQIFKELVALLKGHSPDRLEAFKDFIDEEAEIDKVTKLPQTKEGPKGYKSENGDNS